MGGPRRRGPGSTPTWHDTTVGVVLVSSEFREVLGRLDRGPTRTPPLGSGPWLRRINRPSQVRRGGSDVPSGAQVEDEDDRGPVTLNDYT